MKSSGIDFFPVSVSFFEDEKIVLTESEFGWKGSYIAIRILALIYRHEGYFIKWDQERCMNFSKSVDVNPALVEEIVGSLLKRDFFDKKLYDTEGILTSRGIQLRYLSITRRRLDVTMRKEYLLADTSPYPNVKIYEVRPESTIPKKKRRRIPVMSEQQERWDIIAYFMTEKNFVSPVKQFDKFRNWNNVQNGWATMQHSQRMSAASLWTQKDDNDNVDARKRFKPDFLPVWKKVYEHIKLSRPELIPDVLNEQIKWVPDQVQDMFTKNQKTYHVLQLPKDLADYIHKNWKTFCPMFSRILNGCELRFTYTKS